MKTPTVATTHRFTDEERHGVYRAIYERRDVRSRFAAEPLPDDVLSRILDAAHDGQHRDARKQLFRRTVPQRLRFRDR